MKLLNLIWVLALAGAAMACNSGDPVQGCLIDPSTGLCERSGGGTGGIIGGGGSGGSAPQVCDPGTAEFTNACTCSSSGEVDILCDYGCVALAVTFGLAAVLEVIPDDGFVGGGASNVNFDGFFNVSESFIAGAEDTVGPLSEAVVLPGSTLPVTALSGATGPDVVVTLPDGFVLDLTQDPNNNGIKGPFPLPFVPNGGTYTFGAAGTEACFNLSTGIGFTLNITDPPLFPVPFVCQPANQELINQSNVECPNGDADCLAPSECDATESPPTCTAVIEPEAESGQVCFMIP